MSRLKPGRSLESMRKTILNKAAKSFLRSGFTETKLKNIADESNLNIGSLINLFPHKEDILCALVDYVVDGQFKAVSKILGDKESDLVLQFALDTSLELAIVESSEQVRDLYLAAYSLPKSADEIYKRMTEKVMASFAVYFPGYEAKDFYEMEIASAGIMRAFISVPCDMYFTMSRKIRRYLETALRVYRVPEEKIEEMISFISELDLPHFAEKTVQAMLEELDHSDI